MNMLSLFSGIGGIDLAAHRAGIRPVAFCEIDSFCQQVLKKHWPSVPIYDDVRGITRKKLEKDGIITDEKEIDVVAGGFPCQPFSVAGKQRGTKDDRHLWPEMFRVIKDIRPSWVVGENVTGLIRLGLDDVLDDLESEDYTARTFVFPASAIGAPHQRQRVFIVAHCNRKRRNARCNNWPKRSIQADEDWDDSQDQQKRARVFSWFRDDCQIITNDGINKKRIESDGINKKKN